MSLLNWSELYSVNNEILDDQNKILFDLFRKLYDICMNNRDDVAYLPVVDELLQYTAAHFSDEENSMREMAYPNIEKHVQLHNEFARNIVVLKYSYECKNIELCLDLILLILNWIHDHIIGEDRKFVDFVTSLKGSDSCSKI
jgi:hemerythrin-like metal-binding protein